MQKILCDICERELDMMEDGALAMFEFIKIQTQNILSFKKKEEKLIKIHFDLCKDCAEKVEKFLNEQKVEYITKTNIQN